MMRSMAVWVMLAAVTPMAAAGQGVEARSIELWVGHGTWSGQDVESMDAGLQGGLAVLVETAPHVAFGLQAYLGGYEQLGQTVSEVGADGLARYSVGRRAGLHAFVQGRVGWSRLSADAITQDGFVIGPELGVELPLGAHVRLVLAGGGTWRSYENARLGAGGFPLVDSGGSGFQYGGRVGLSVEDIF